MNWMSTGQWGICGGQRRPTTYQAGGDNPWVMSHDLTVEEGLFVGHKNDEEIGGL